MASAGDVDWATAELYAFGSLVMQGRAVRVAGQDTRRGTFTQRHATLIDRNTGTEYTPLKNLSDDQAPFWIYDSLLSEYAAMGFEYGYSVVREDALVCWEAQFGDFADGAQTIIDEFISSGEAKWGQRSAVTLLLPHGYEGQGPDHSSGRPERFLQPAAEQLVLPSHGQEQVRGTRAGDPAGELREAPREGPGRLPVARCDPRRHEDTGRTRVMARFIPRMISA
jgi:2-oxoglutarate dehydrogenase E1 component